MTYMNSGNRQIDWAVVIFFALAYTLAWGAFGIIALIANQSGIETQALLVMGETWQYGDTMVAVPAWSVYLLTRLADFAFSIAGIIMIMATAGRDGLRELWQRLTHWRFHPRWYLLGLLPLGLYALATVIAGALPSATVTLSTLNTILFSLHAGFFVSLFLRGAFGEELGLRGFALPRLQAYMSPFRASLIIGALWGVWHLPVLIGRDVLTIVVFLLLSFGLSFIFTRLFNGSGGSLIPVLLFHATQNWEEGFETLFPVLVGTEWELISTLSLLVIGIIAGVLVWRDSQRDKTQNIETTFVGMRNGASMIKAK
ncbi:MAG: CPBP family intramembrane glutamic endopeptidase [Chloroflexota bacterium]